MIPGSAHALMLGGDLCERYKIGNSVRFNAPDTSYLSRTFAAGDRKKWTFSAWVKRSAIGVAQTIFAQGTGVAASGYGFLHFLASNTLELHTTPDGGTPSLYWQSAMLFRDTGAHFHLQVVVDTAQAIGADRVKVSVNGNQIAGSMATTPALNADLEYNRASAHELGAQYSGALSEPLSGYLSEIHFVDGQALDPSAFGFTCPTTGQWRPKAYAGTYGTNGFHLDFSDGSAATAAALGADRSGNGNNWTPTNISVAAGAGCDWLEDTPTNNFCTLNPLSKTTSLTAATLSNGSLTIRAGSETNGTPGSYATSPGTMLLSGGKWYFEVSGSQIAGSSGSVYAGLCNQLSFNFNSSNYYHGSFSNVVKAQTAATDVLMVAYDANVGLAWVGKNGVWDAGDPTAGTGGTTFAGPVVPFVEAFNDTVNQLDAHANFGQRPFTYTPPAGFKALCAKSLLRPRIAKPETAFVARSDSGANIAATLATARAGWTDYIEIFKRRDAAEGWRWRFSDDLANYLDSSSTAAKTAFPALAGTSYIGYAIKVAAANGVTTGRLVHVNGVADVVADGLSNSRKMIILKNEATGTWYVYHPDLTAGKLLYLEQTAAETIDATISAVTSSGFTVAAALATGTYRWIALSEVDGFLKLGKHSGNSSADGPFNNAGLCPSFCVTKSPSAAGANYEWYVFDSTRDKENVITGSDLELNSTSGEGVSKPSYAMDFVSNGQKIRSFSEGINNTSGYSYVWLMIASFPFKHANAR